MCQVYPKTKSNLPWDIFTSLKNQNLNSIKYKPDFCLDLIKNTACLTRKKCRQNLSQIRKNFKTRIFQTQLLSTRHITTCRTFSITWWIIYFIIKFSICNNMPYHPFSRKKFKTKSSFSFVYSTPFWSFIKFFTLQVQVNTSKIVQGIIKFMKFGIILYMNNWAAFWKKKKKFSQIIRHFHEINMKLWISEDSELVRLYSDILKLVSYLLFLS